MTRKAANPLYYVPRGGCNVHLVSETASSIKSDWPVAPIQPIFRACSGNRRKAPFRPVHSVGVIWEWPALAARQAARLIGAFRAHRACRTNTLAASEEPDSSKSDADAATNPETIIFKTVSTVRTSLTASEID